MKRTLCFAVMASLALGAPVLAANSGSGEIGFGVGQSDVGSDTTGVDSAQFIGVRGGYHLTEQWQVEGMFSSASENGDVSGTDVDTTMRVIMVNGVMNFHPRKKEVVPYVMAGIGRADVEVDAGGTTGSDNSIAYQVGGGTRIYFGKAKRTAFRADLTLLKENTFEDSSTITTVTAGVTWNLGGK